MRYWIDGYNAIFSDTTAPSELRASREWLIARLQPLAVKHDVVIVFDAPSQEGGASRNHIGPLEIVYTAQGESADTYILSLVEHAKNPQTAVVVTGDRRLQRFCRDHGARTIAPVEFFAGIQKAPRCKEVKPYISSDQERKRWFQIFRKRLEKEE